MNIIKHANFFDPITDIKSPIHIIGCGAIGSTVAEMLTRMGVEKLNLYDFDTITPHNLANQMFFESQIGKSKIHSLYDILTHINPTIEITVFPSEYKAQPLAGYIFLCVDDIDLRRQIATNNRYNTNIKAMFDFRMRLTDAQHYAADWQNAIQIEDFLNSMNFTHEEAKESTPTNACGTSMNIIPTVRTIVSFGLANFINFIKTKTLKKLILVDAFHFTLDAF